MRRHRTLVPIVAVLALGVLGCTSLRYYREVSPEIEQARQEYVVNNPGNRYNNDILEGRVRPGMSRLQVRCAWGEADQIEAGKSPNITEVWAYEETEPSRGSMVYRLHFDGERLAELTTERGVHLLPTSDVDRNQTRRQDPVRQGTSDRKPR